ncbi:helix-turn-helix domain-containing protein [Rhodococcus sp. 3Y1]
MVGTQRVGDAAATALNIHRHTLRSRLARIESLLQLDLGSPRNVRSCGSSTACSATPRPSDRQPTNPERPEGPPPGYGRDPSESIRASRYRPTFP